MQATQAPQATPAAQATKPLPVATPTVRRRLMAMLYEAFCLFAVGAFAIGLYMLLTLNSQHPVAKIGMNVWLVAAAGAYFMWCWIDSGHTLAMKTWRMKVVKVGCRKVPFRAALLRYVLAWGWFAPALAVRAAFDLHGKAETAILLGAGLVAWSLTAFLDRDRQFLHDRLAGTRLIVLPKAASWKA